MGKKVAIVTGANRGIGFEVARQLLQSFPGDVIVTGRDTTKGKKACQQLSRDGLVPVWHELDVTQSASVRMFMDYIRDNYSGIDVIVSNAGVNSPKDSSLSMFRQAELAVQTNFRGSLSLLRHMLPLLRPHSRVIIMSSEIGKLRYLGPEIRKKFDLEKMNYYDLDQLAESYLSAVKAQVWEKYGWPDRIVEAIGMFQNALAYILARDLRKDARRNILINAVCPGWTATDQMKTHLDENGCLSGVKARQPEESARDIVKMALLPSGTVSPNGKVVHNGQVVDDFE